MRALLKLSSSQSVIKPSISVIIVDKADRRGFGVGVGVRRAKTPAGVRGRRGSPIPNPGRGPGLSGFADPKPRPGSGVVCAYLRHNSKTQLHMALDKKNHLALCTTINVIRHSDLASDRHSGRHQMSGTLSPS